MTEEELVEFTLVSHKAFVDLIKVRFEEDLTNYNVIIKERNKNFFGECNNYTNEIIYYILNGNYNNDKNYIKNFILEAIAHELAHAIADRYNLVILDEDHNISFALVSYCLQRELMGKRFFFYRPYDFAEEFNIKKIKINDSRLSRLIKNIEFNTIKELAEKTFDYAEYVREKILKTQTYKQFRGEVK